MHAKTIMILILFNMFFLHIVTGQNSTILEPEEKVKQEATLSLKEAINELDYTNILFYGSDELKKDSINIKKRLKEFEKLKSNSQDVEHVEILAEAEREGYYGIKKFKPNGDEVDSLEIKYYFLKKYGELILTEIQFNQSQKNTLAYPKCNYTISQKIEELESLNETKEYKRKIEIYDELIELTKENIRNNILFFKDPINTLSEFYGGKAWYYCLTDEGDKAILNAKIGLALDNTNNWIITNLALGNIINGNYNKAEKLYLSYGNQLIDPETTFKEVFLSDLEYVTSLDIKISGIELARAVLNKM